MASLTGLPVSVITPLRDMVNKGARVAINHCLTHGIGTIVVGWNIGIKDGADMGKQSNQQFVQMPLARLKERIKQLCEIYGIHYVETEEANTSAASYIDKNSVVIKLHISYAVVVVIYNLIRHKTEQRIFSTR